MTPAVTKDPAAPFLAKAEENGRALYEALDGAVGHLPGVEHGAALELRADAEALLRRLRNPLIFRDRP